MSILSFILDFTRSFDGGETFSIFNFNLDFMRTSLDGGETFSILSFILDLILESWFSSIHISLKASAGEKKSVYLENGVLEIGSCTKIVIEIIRFWYKMSQIP